MGRRVPAATRSGARTARATTASSSSKTPTATAVTTSRPCSSTTASNLSGIELGFGGVWLCSSPNLRLRPDPRSDDKPAASRRCMLDGWNMKDTKHNIFNRSAGGRTAGSTAATASSRRSWVGKPGTPKKERAVHRLRRLALPSDAEGVRGGRPRHDEPLGPRLGRVRRDVHHQLRDRPPLPRRPRRALRADVRPGPEPARLRPDEELRRPQALGRRRLDEFANDRRRRQAGTLRRRRRPRPLRAARSTSATTSRPSTATRSSPATSTATASTTTGSNARTSGLQGRARARTSCSPTTRGSAASA